MTETKSAQCNIRIEKSILERMEKAAREMSKQVGVPISLSALARLAIIKFLEGEAGGE